MGDERVRKAICTELVRLLRAERQRQGLSMNVLAERSGLSQSFISMFEAPLDNPKAQPANPTVDTLLRISEVLDVDLGAFFQKATANVRK